MLCQLLVNLRGKHGDYKCMGWQSSCKKSPTKMPPLRPSVHFEARPLLDDEYAVVHRFIDHISRCRVCRIHNERDLSFCPRGYGYKKDVRQYIYMKKDVDDERVYSEIDLQSIQQERPLSIPTKYEAVRHVLRGRGRAEPRIRLRVPNERHPPEQEVPPQPPQSYRDPEYVTVLARFPAIYVPLEIPISELRSKWTGR